MIEEICWFTKPPKDREEQIFFADTGRNLKASEEYLVLTKCGEYNFGNYVHSRKVWLDRQTFEIEDVIRWCKL